MVQGDCHTTGFRFEGFLRTPPLWTGSGFFPFPQFELPPETLSQLPRLAFSEPEPMVLGKRAELYFLKYLENFTTESVLVHNVQIQSERTTIGELDFLLRNKRSGILSHVELVYKFYIYDPGFENEKERWIGPNRKDTLLKKLQKLDQQQFPLLWRKETTELLKKLQVFPEEVRQMVCFKANLFLPLHIKKREIPLINNACIIGYWIKESEFIQEDFVGYRFYSPEKKNWPIHPSHNSIWYDFQEIKEFIRPFLENEKSPLIWAKKGDDIYERFFVVWW